MTTGKNILIGATLAAALSLTACNGEIEFGSNESIDGSGNLTTEVYEVENFDEIEICCDLNIAVEIDEGSDKQLEITVDDNLHQHLIVDVVNGESLSIRQNRNANIDSTQPILLRVSGYEITELAVDTSSSLIGDFPPVDKFTIKADTDANVTIAVDADKVVIEADTSAMVNVEGRAGFADIKADADADVFLTAMQIDDAKIDASTSANVEIEATGSIEAKATTDAQIDIWGDPKLDLKTATDGAINRRG